MCTPPLFNRIKLNRDLLKVFNSFSYILHNNEIFMFKNDTLFKKNISLKKSYLLSLAHCN